MNSYAVFKKTAGLLAAAIVLVPAATQAAPVTWNFSGSLSTVENAPASFLAGVNTPITLAFTFDSSLITPTSIAGLYAGNAMQLSLNAGFDCRNETLVFDPCTDEANSASTGFVNYFNDVNGTDGIWFNLFPSGLADGERWSLRFSGPSSTWTTIPGALPEVPDPALTSISLAICGKINLQNADYLFSGCTAGEPRILSNDLRLTSVPEPATLTLMGAGLAVLGFARRRRRAS